ncbi:Signal transducer regulating beta-lactamase production, contains metallopeptidase domain [Zunongwangia mangrovi]|uniref:Signal transducer regulating beta-lactamase production, contains metallopeptidase domain n=1 Tax=Zunongwangia mangrovi TaxID=1334022 RepID=A0A1I1MN72_9FLAO|nr:M56 family metallopeptidase [Zunongwangia mangrovi]SFC83000.1 Signal transducer regulating beta-lactamase production, contains metallopeptidase domain [Zunongwangia mangrovi]
MLFYILKFTGCLLVLYSFYRLFLENEKNHEFKRFYLLFALVASVIIPLITITYKVEAQTIEQTGILLPETITNVEEVKTTSWKDHLPAILWSVYSIGSVVFLIRFLKNLQYLKKLIQQCEKVKEPLSTKILLPFQQIPYSYFRYIFVDKEAFKTNSIPQEILKHEEAHVHQKHTLDLLILEILQIIFWFNPLFIFIKKSIRLNHEFLADEAVLNQNISALSYSTLLLNSSFGKHQSAMTSSFKHSLIKKRIVMISNSFSKKRVGLKLGFLVPVLCCCIYFFNNDIVAETIQQESPIVTETLNAFTLKIHGEKIELNGEQVLLEEFASKLDKITNQYPDKDLLKNNVRLDLKNVPEDFKKKVGKEYLKTHYYQVMKKNSRNTSLFPSGVPVPPAPPAPPMQISGRSGTSYITTDSPTKQQIKEWKNKGYTFYFDNNPISKEKLDAIDLNTISLYSKQIDETGTKIYLNTVYSQYSKNPPSKSLLSDQNLKIYGQIFIDGKEVSRKKVKDYSAQDFKAYWIVKDGKLPTNERLILKLSTEEVPEVVEEVETIEIIEDKPQSPPSPKAPEVIEVIEDVPEPPKPEIIEVVEDVPNPPAPPKQPEIIEVIEVVEDDASISNEKEVIEVVEEELGMEINNPEQEKSVKELIKDYNGQLKKVKSLLPEGYPMAYFKLEKKEQDKILKEYNKMFTIYILLQKQGAEKQVDRTPPPPPSREKK